MPTLIGEEGALIIEPEGDIIFADAFAADGSRDYIELVIAQPGEVYEPGALARGLCGKTTKDIKALVRIRLNTLSCAVMMERLSIIQIALLGLKPLASEVSE